MRFTIRSLLISVQNGRHRAEHLQNERFAIHQVELLDRVLDRCGNQFIGLMQRIDLQQSWHYHKVSEKDCRLVYELRTTFSLPNPLVEKMFLKLNAALMKVAIT